MKKVKIFGAALACLLMTAQLHAVERMVHGKKQTAFSAGQWEVLDIAFTGIRSSVANPFMAEFTATFTNGASELRVPGFYDGADTYVVRFTAPAAGEWKFETTSKIARLNGLKGAVRVDTKTKKRGPVMADPARPQRLVYANGSSYFQNAAEVDWLFALDYGDGQGTPKLDTLLDTYRRCGINQIIFNIYAWDVTWARDPALKPEYDYGGRDYFPFAGTNTAPDYSTLNVDFFRHIDRVLTRLDDYGMTAHMMIYVWNKKVNWPERWSDGDRMFYDYTVKRYQAFPNLVWDVSKEALAHGQGGETGIDFISRKIDRLRELDGYGRMVTVHDYAYCSKNPDRVDIISVQNWKTDLYSRMKEIVARFPNKPVFNIENGSYERGPYRVVQNDYEDKAIVLERAYQAIFAGSYPSYYWQGNAWNVLIHDPMSLPEAQRPAFAWYGHMTGFFTKYDYNRFTTFERELSSGLALANAALDQFIFMIPKENELITVKFSTLLSGSQVFVEWFNPYTGEYIREEPFAFRRNTKLIPPWPRQISIAVLTEIK